MGIIDISQGYRSLIESYKSSETGDTYEHQQRLKFLYGSFTFHCLNVFKVPHDYN
jgi:hypothetical protein